MTYLDDWAVLERDHIDAVSKAVEDLEASTLRLPVTGGAMVCVAGRILFFFFITEETMTSLLCFTLLQSDIEHLKVAICQAVDVMQAMASAICSLLSQVN